MSNPEPQPILTVTWDTVIGARPGHSDPGDVPTYDPVSLGDAVVEEIAARLTKEIKRDSREGRYLSAVQEARAAAVEAVKTEAAAVVREALAEGVQLTDTWGQPQGPRVSLRDLILDEVRKYLAEKPPRPGYGDRERPGGFAELLRTAVTDGLRKELADEIKAARAEVAAKVRERAAEILGDVVKAQVR